MSNTEPQMPSVWIYDTKNDLLEDFNGQEDKDDYTFLSKDISVSCKGAKQFTFMKTGDVEQFIKDLPAEQRTYYELEIYDDTIKQRRKLKLDFDLKPEDPLFLEAQENEDTIMNELITYSQEIFKELYPEHIISSNNIILFNSSCPTKVSYHIVINSFSVSDHYQAKEFMHRMRALDWKWGKFIDISPYSSFQNFRLPKCHKIGKTNTKKCASFQDGSFPTFLDCLTTYVNTCTELPDLETVKRHGDNSSFPKLIVSDEQSDRVFELFSQIDKNADTWRPRNVKGGIFCFKQLSPYDCALCKRVHDGSSDNCSLYLTLNSEGDVNQHCRRFEDEGKGNHGFRIFNIETGEQGEKVFQRLLPKNCLIQSKEDNAKGKVSLMSYNETKSWFEQTNFKIISRGMYYNTDFRKFYTEKKLLDSFRHINYLTFGKNKKPMSNPFVKKWISDPDIRAYNYINLYPPPKECPKDTFNLWEGFEIEECPSEELEQKDVEDLEFLYNHIFLLCDKDIPIFDYIKNWIAYLFQFPGIKPNIMILIKSLPGLGKEDGLYNILAEIIGRHYCLITQKTERDILGSFNAPLKDKLLVVMDEMSLKVARENKENLKSLITTKLDSITLKGVDTAEYPSHTHYMSFSNNDFPWSIDDEDRRYFAIDASGQNIPKDVYFTRLRGIQSNRKVLRKFYDEMLEIDLDEWSAKNDRPETNFMKQLKSVNRDHETQFIIEFIQGLTEDITITSKDLFLKFFNFLQTHQTTENIYSTTNIKFGIKITNMKIGGVVKSKAGCVKYTFSFKKGIEWLESKKYIEFHERLI